VAKSARRFCPGKSADSLLVQMIEGRLDGKKKIMPPGNARNWPWKKSPPFGRGIDAGAQAPSGAIAAKELIVPQITPKSSPRIPINTFAWASGEKLLAAARYATIELRSAPTLILSERSNASRQHQCPGFLPSIINCSPRAVSRVSLAKFACGCGRRYVGSHHAGP